MKKNLLIINTIFALLASNNVLAAGSTTATLDVKLTIIPGCYIGNKLTTLGTINFGSVIDLSNTPIRVPYSHTDNGSIDLYCSAGTTAVVKIDNGLHSQGGQRRLNDNDNFANYNLYQDSAYNQPWPVDGFSMTANNINTAIPLTFYAEVPVQNTPEVGTYTDTVSVTVAW